MSPSKIPLSRHELNKRHLFLKRLASLFPDMAESDIRSMLERNTRTSFWINPLRAADKTQVLEDLALRGIGVTPHRLMPHAFTLVNEADRPALIESDLFDAGKIFVQNPSSYLPVLALDPKPGERILDMCASPGGKSSLMAALTSGRCELWVNDKLPARVRKLKEVLDLLGVQPKEFLQEPAEHLWKLPRLADMRFDKVLLDAQCTGEGLLDFREPRAMEHWSMGRVEEYSYLQQRMLVSAFKLLKTGGTLVYSTCTFGPDENEVPLSFLLSKFNAKVEPLDFPLPAASVSRGVAKWLGQGLDSQLGNALRVKPDGIMGGFFVCKLTKLEQEQETAGPGKKKSKRNYSERNRAWQRG